MGSSTKTTKQQQSGTTAETATTAPNTFAPALPGVTNYYQGLTDIGAQIKADPYSYTAGINPLQTQAYNNAQSLGGWQGLLGQSTNLAANAATAGPNTYTAPTLGAAAQASGGGVSAAQLGPAAQAALAQAQAAKAGNATMANAAQAGPASSLLENLQSYMNPFTENVVDTSLADFDVNAGRQRAAQQAAAAKGGAFGGSRYGVAQAALEGEIGRGRGALDAGLRSDAFNTGASLSADDANRRQAVNLFNTGNQQQTNLANAGFDNQFKLTDAGFQQEANLFNTGQKNQTSQFNTGQTNQQTQYGAGLQNAANIAGAANQTQIGIANANAQNQMAQLQAQLSAQGGMFNAGQQDNALARQLQAAGLLQNGAGLFGQQQLADVNSQANIGNSYFDAQNQYMQSPLTNYGAYSQLLNPGLIDTLSGQTINSNGTSSSTGKGTEKTSGGALGVVGGLLGGIGGLATGLGGMGLKF